MTVSKTRQARAVWLTVDGKVAQLCIRIFGIQKIVDDVCTEELSPDQRRCVFIAEAI